MFFLYFLPPARKACTIPDPEPLLHTQNSSRGPLGSNRQNCMNSFSQYCPSHSPAHRAPSRRSPLMRQTAAILRPGDRTDYRREKYLCKRPDAFADPASDIFLYRWCCSAVAWKRASANARRAPAVHNKFPGQSHQRPRQKALILTADQNNINIVVPRNKPVVAYSAQSSSRK